MIEDILKRLEIAWKLNALEPTPFDEDDDLIIAKKNIFEIFRQELTALVDSVPSEKSNEEPRFDDTSMCGWNAHCDLVSEWKKDKLK